MKLDASLEKLFTTSECGFHLEDRHFYAIYKTRLLKYDGRAVSDRGRGNIISVTELFAAKDEDDAKLVAQNHFNVYNPTFRQLNQTKIEEVEHILVELKEYIPPTFSDENFRSFNKQKYSDDRHFLMHRIIIHQNRGEPLPASFLGFQNCLIRRIQPHILSRHATAYLYHPWHGAGDSYTDWHRCAKGTGNYSKLEQEFNIRKTDEAKRFSVTEYTDLDYEEQELIRKLKRLQALDRQQFELCNDDTFLHRDLMQGRFFNEFGDVIFIPDETNCLRLSFLAHEDKVSEAKVKKKQLEYKRASIEKEISSLQKFIEGES